MASRVGECLEQGELAVSYRLDVERVLPASRRRATSASWA
jgi:hypothetical protein